MIRALAVLSLCGLLATKPSDPTEGSPLWGLRGLCGQIVFQDDKILPLTRELESADVRKIYHAVSDLAALGEPALPSVERRAKDAKGRARDYLNLVVDEIRSARLTTGVPPIQRLSMKATDRNVV